MNRLVAAFGGALKDAVDEGGPTVQSPIFQHGQSELLEAEGLDRHAAHISSAVTVVKAAIRGSLYVDEAAEIWSRGLMPGKPVGVCCRVGIQNRNTQPVKTSHGLDADHCSSRAIESGSRHTAAAYCPCGPPL